MPAQTCQLSEEIDFLIAYVVSENLWYVFPVHLFPKIRHVKVHPFRKHPPSRYEIYREAWDFMRYPKPIAEELLNKE